MALPAHHHTQHLLLLYQTGTPLVVQRHGGPQVHQEVYRTGDLGLFPGGEYGTITWTAPATTST
jgi:AraC family transcriptional regulator